MRFPMKSEPKRNENRKGQELDKLLKPRLGCADLPQKEISTSKRSTYHWGPYIIGLFDFVIAEVQFGGT